MQFTDNQLKNIHDAIIDHLVDSHDLVFETKWDPSLDFHCDGIAVTISRDREVVVNGNALEGPWKGRGVASKIAAAIASELSSTTSATPTKNNSKPTPSPAPGAPPASVPAMTNLFREA